MKILTNKEVRNFILLIGGLFILYMIFVQMFIWFNFHVFVIDLLVCSILLLVILLAVCFKYFYRQNKIMETAVTQINAYLAGDTGARIKCDKEGQLYKLFHSVNTLAAVLNAHAENEQRSKEFLKNTISDISHQLKTPLAALNIYNGLLQGEAKEFPSIEEFILLSEQELDRIETLVQNLLKITKLDAGTMVINKSFVNISDMMKDIELHFSYRAKQEQKAITLSGSNNTMLYCDRDWIIEAISNIVKNALDHTRAGNHVIIEWEQLPLVTRIFIKDDGNGIHPEDLHYIFKRFYRSRFSSDTQGIGLGLPLAKAIVEAHDGNITVDSVLERGSTFIISFLNPTKL